MTAQLETHVVLLTFEGRGAIASLLVAGPKAATIVAELFHLPRGQQFAEQPVGRILLGRWLNADAGEQIVVCRRDDDRIEIHCHGGVAAARAIIESLGERGCREIKWRQWLHESTSDRIEAAAQIALAAAPTKRTAAILWDQLGGALRRAFDGIAARIAAGDSATALHRLDELLAWAPVGQHLVNPWQVVLAGWPNVGKSSLINALVGYERAIVHPMPGTTRDIVTAASAIDGWPIELADTAGLRASDEPIESAGVARARERAAAADLIVLVFDASTSWSDEQQTLVGDWPGALCVFNKSDLLGPEYRANAPHPGLYTSAARGDGIVELAREIGRRLVPRPPAVGQAMPFSVEQVQMLALVRDALVAGQSARAENLLSGHEIRGGRSC